MAELDWHADRTDNSNLVTLDNLRVSDLDIQTLQKYRLERVREQMQLHEIDACILSDAVNIRYATGARNMQIFTARNAPSRYLILTQKDSILFEFKGCEHLASGLNTITSVETSSTASFVASGMNIEEKEKQWIQNISDRLQTLVGAKATIGIERLNANISIGLQDKGFVIKDAQLPVELARAIKSQEEMKCIHSSLRATENGVHQLKKSIKPGISENELWSVLHQAIIAQDGDYCETRLLSSGQKTNPWFQETGPRLIQQNELIALDTDVVGCYGYYSDFSRTFHAGPDGPSSDQKLLYSIAKEQVEHNMSIIQAGMSFKEYSEKAWDIPEEFYDNRYYLSAHGCGMTGEYPYLYHHGDYDEAGYDGTILPGMTICVESYIGRKNGREGVKLEQQILIKENGNELLSQFPFENSFLN